MFYYRKQLKYGRLVEEIGIGMMQKSTSNSTAMLIEAMYDILDGDLSMKLRHRAKTIARMLKTNDDESVLIRSMEFVAEFGRVDALQVYANQLNIIQVNIRIDLA